MFLEQNGLTASFFEQLTDDKFAKGFVNLYERKVYIIGLTSALNAETMPEAMQPFLLRLIQSVIKMLNLLREAEMKTLKKEAKKEIKVNDNEDDSGDEEDGESEEEDENGEDAEDEAEDEPDDDQDMAAAEHSHHKHAREDEEEEEKEEPKGGAAEEAKGAR